MNSVSEKIKNECLDGTSDVFAYNVGHGGFTARATAISDDNTVESLSLSWTPFVSESE